MASSRIFNRLGGNFRIRAGIENFNKLVRCDLQIKSEQPAIFEKIEMPLQSQRAAIKIQAAIQVFRENAKMRERFDHGLNELNPARKSNCFNCKKEGF